MEKGLFCTFKKNIYELKNEIKVYKKLGNSYKLKRFVSKISEFGRDNGLYTFLMRSLANIDFDKIERDFSDIIVLDEKNDKSLKITLLPNYKDVETVIIELKDNGIINKKTFTFKDDIVNVIEYKEKDNVRIKTKREYIDNQLVYEDVSRIKGDNDSYYWINNTTHLDENYTAIMEEFIQVRKDGMIESQRVNFYRGHLLEEANFYTRSGYNVDYLYEYLEDDKYEISRDRYYSELDKNKQKESKVVKLVQKKKD